MKKSPMPPRAKPMARTARLERHTRLAYRSKKMSAEYVDRRVLVADLLEERPWCEIRWDENCQGRAVDVDEIFSRARGGDFLDPANCQTACRYCHSMKHAEPAEAVARGFALNSWDWGAA